MGSLPGAMPQQTFMRTQFTIAVPMAIRFMEFILHHPAPGIGIFIRMIFMTWRATTEPQQIHLFMGSIFKGAV